MSIILDIHVLNEEMKILFAHWRMFVKPKLWWHVDMFCSVVSDLSCELHSRYLHLSQMCVTNDPKPSKMHSFIENSDWLSLSSPATTLTCVSSVITHCNISVTWFTKIQHSIHFRQRATTWAWRRPSPPTRCQSPAPRSTWTPPTWSEKVSRVDIKLQL